jgi:beta-glucanase (GH16 family)
VLRVIIGLTLASSHDRRTQAPPRISVALHAVLMNSGLDIVPREDRLVTLKRPHRSWRAYLGGACAMGLTAGLGFIVPTLVGTAAATATDGNHPVELSIVPDAASVQPTQVIGYTITVTGSRPGPGGEVLLEDNLPTGGDLSWAVDDQSGISSCGVSGPVGAQLLSCPPVQLAVGQSYSLHIFSHTWDSTSPTVTDRVTVLGSGLRVASASAAINVEPASCLSSPADPSRQLLFDDEFNDSAIDTSKWNVGVLPFPGYDGSTHYHNKQYDSYIVPQDSFVKNGVLNLSTNDIPVTNPDVPAIGTIPYTEGMVNTKGKFSVAGGYFEICAKFPAGKGLWPAFWLAAQNGVWPPEIDVAEWFGGLEALQIGQPWATGPPPVWETAGSEWLSTWRYSNAPTTGYHDYAVWWSPGSPGTVRYYIDGQMVHEIDGSTSDLIPDTPMYMILNSGVWAGPTRGGPPDATTVFPNSFQVAYVRVYKAPPPQNTNYSAP